MSEQDEGFLSDLGDMWDSGVSAAEHLGGAAVDLGAGVIDQMQAGAQGILAGADYVLGDEEGAQQHWDAAEDNVYEMSDNYNEAIDQIF